MKLVQQGGDRRVFIELSDSAEKELERLFWKQGEWSNTPCALAIVNDVLHIHWLEPSHTYHVMPDKLPNLKPVDPSAQKRAKDSGVVLDELEIKPRPADDSYETGFPVPA